MTAFLLAMVIPLAMASAVHAGSTIYVTTTHQQINDDSSCSLQEAIYAANFDDNKAPDISNPGQFITTGCEAGSGADIIELPPGAVFSYLDPIDDADNFAGPSVTPIITSTITIEGRGARLARVSFGRPTRAFVVGATGFLDLREIHIEGFFIQGGNGGNGGGGGGMGAGGAIYVQAGRLLVQWSTFEGNGVRGGNGGDEGFLVEAGGGGGGLSGNGGGGDYSGGGGGGSRGNGGAARLFSGTYWGGGGGGRVTSGSGETPGEPCGGAGGESGFGYGGDGDSADNPPFYSCPGGGGGGGSGTSDLFSGDGGAGSYGGGGGGGGGAPGLFPSGYGGHGGFGGGGGGSEHNEGGHGGFGGGGGRGSEVFSEGRGQGGTFAGDGDRAGGGGAGLGGAIFGYLGDIDIVNSTFTENWAEWGRAGEACGFYDCGPGANDGRGAGGAIFTVAGDLRIANSTIAGNMTETVTNGGGGGIVVYQPVDPDENGYATFVLRNSIVAYNGAAECYTWNGVTTTGSENNIITDSTPNNLGHPPCPGVTTAADPLLGDLAYNPPGTTPTMGLGAGSPALDAAIGAFPPDDQRGILRPQGAGADIGAVELSSQPPTTTISLAPVAPNGSNGWYVSAVGVTIIATDPELDLAQTRCVLDPTATPAGFADLPDASCALTSVSADGEHAIYAASVDDQGNEETPVRVATFRVDRTEPTLNPSLNVPTPILVGQTGVVASPNAGDATSGVASSSCEIVDTSTPGVHTVSCSATDNAGNAAIRDLTYVVEYKILGFFSPVPESHWKVGQRVPVKVALADAADIRIADDEAAALAASCRVVFQASGAQSKGPDCMKYDAVYDQFVYTWKLGKNGTGPATIVVRVSYPGTAARTELSEPIVIMR